MSPGRVSRILRSLRRDETGAVTIDWVAVTAGILLLGIMVVYSIFNGGVSSLVSNVNSSLVSANPELEGNADAVLSGKASVKGCKQSGQFVVCFGPK